MRKVDQLGDTQGGWKQARRFVDCHCCNSLCKPTVAAAVLGRRSRCERTTRNKLHLIDEQLNVCESVQNSSSSFSRLCSGTSSSLSLQRCRYLPFRLASLTCLPAARPWLRFGASEPVTNRRLPPAELGDDCSRWCGRSD